MEGNMARKRYGIEEIIPKLREVEIHLSKGVALEDACRKIGVTEQTYYRWRKEYGGLRMDQARRLRQLEKENQQLKKVVADVSLDKAILKEALEGNY
jgi:transposase-like protein